MATSACSGSRRRQLEGHGADHVLRHRAAMVVLGLEHRHLAFFLGVGGNSSRKINRRSIGR
jgi:hypothetical protein